MQLSPQQAAVIEWVKTGKGSAFGEAVAGAGKTTTAMLAAAEMDGYVSVMAYNKKASDEFTTKARKLNLNFGNKVQFGTCHSFGLRAWRRVYPNVKVDDKGKRDMTIAQLRKAGAPERLDGFVLKLTSLAKQAAIGLFGDMDDQSKWYELVEHHDLAEEIELEGDADLEIAEQLTVEKGIGFAIRALKYHRALAPTIVDFDDMIYMPIVSNIKMFQVDWIIGDEWQDANAARRALVRKMLKPNGRALFIGDRHQAIYGFTGADNDSIENTIREFRCSELPMTVSFRCPQTVVAEAQKFVPHIQACDTAPVGTVAAVSHEDFAKQVKQLVPTDAILCRKTKPLIDCAYSLIRQGIGCHVEGRDIGQGLLKLVGRWKVKSLNALRGKLEVYVEQQTQKLIAKGRETQAEALQDRVATIFAIMDSVPPATTVNELRNRINELFMDTTSGDDAEKVKPTVTLSTVHKAKGREWPRVFVLGWADFMPSKWARQEWQQVQERNLQYVAITRAQADLVYINGVPA